MKYLLIKDYFNYIDFFKKTSKKYKKIIIKLLIKYIDYFAS